MSRPSRWLPTETREHTRESALCAEGQGKKKEEKEEKEKAPVSKRAKADSSRRDEALKRARPPQSYLPKDGPTYLLDVLVRRRGARGSVHDLARHEPRHNNQQPTTNKCVGGRVGVVVVDTNRGGGGLGGGTRWRMVAR
jgi:hypothetical protein